MPSRNIIKIDSPESYYHIYARGSGKLPIFLEPLDFVYFENLLARYLGPKPVQGKFGYTYPNYRDKVELLAYCLMNNHFHLLLYQADARFMTTFMRSLMTSYSRYFNLKYKRTGPLFESRYKACRVDQQSYLEHISRYIHLNPRYWRRYSPSSLKYYLDTRAPEWLKIDRISSLFNGQDEYLKFLRDYEDHKQMLGEIKHELAG